MTKLKRYQVFLSDRTKQDLRDIHDYILVYASANETLNNSPKEKRKDVRLLYLGIIGYICTQIKKT